MNYRRQRFVTLLALLAAVVTSAVAYPTLPDRMVTHWGAGGVPGG